ncbi:MAG: ribose-5-phosphate isomerase A, partial [Methylotenera sp.]
LEAIGAQGDLRPNAAKDGFWVTSHGSYVLDMKFNEDIQAETLNDLLSNTPGVVEHGIFYGLTDAVLIAADGVVSERWA